MANSRYTADDKSRIDRYKLYEDIFLGKHTAAFSKFSAEMVRKNKVLIYLVCNFGGLISKVSADLLFGESVGFKFAKDADKKAVEFINNFISENDLHTRNYESALSNSYYGDIVAKVWRDDKENVYLDYLSPELLTVEYENDNVRQPYRMILGWIKNINGEQYLRREIHYKGKIENDIWLLKNDELRQKMNLKSFPDYANLPESQATGVDDFLVRLIPNWRIAKAYFGLSDYIDLVSLFDEANNRMSRIAEILNKHSDPKLAVPPGVIREDGTVKGANFDLIEVNSQQTSLTKPEYITWDASLESAFKEIDKIVDFIFLFSETSPAAFGMDKGGQAESGRALKLKLIRTLAKISRKKNYYDSALKWAIKVAQQLGGVSKVTIPSIVWQDGIPADTMEQAQIEEIRLRAGNTSMESSIKRLDGGNDEDIKDEMDKIKGDQKAAAGTLGTNPPQVTL
jgi:hypothetical protein